MALVLADRVRETTTTTGTGSVTLAGAYTGFQTFSAAVGTGNSTYYTIANVGSGEWEVGIGTYSSGGNLLSRTTVLASSNAGSLVNFGSGAKDVFVTQPAERALYIASAGTGLESKVTAFTNGGIVYASSTSALATGSALVFDGSTLTSGSSGTASKLVLQGGAQTSMAIKSSTGTGGFLIGRGFASNDANDFFIYDLATSQNRFFIDTTPNLFQYATAFAWSNAANSTEYMRLTSTGLGIGTSSPVAKLQIKGSGTSGQVTSSFILENNSSGTLGMDITGAAGSSYWRLLYGGGPGTGTNTLSLGMSMVIEGASAGNVGIGTSAPISKLSNTATGIANADGLSTGAPAIQWNTSIQGFTAAFYNSGSGNQFANGLLVKTTGTSNATDTIVDFESGGVNRFRLTGAGNLGLGVAPSDWSPKAIQVGSWGGIQDMGGVANQIAFRGNQYYSSGDKFLNASGYANAIALDATNGILFYTSTAASTSANSSATMSQRMTLDTSGNLGIGITSPVGRLNVKSTYVSDTTTQQRFEDNTGVSLNFGGTGGGKKFIQAQDTAGAATYYDVLINPLGGNLGIGTTSPTYPLTVQANSSTQGIRIIGRASGNLSNMSFVANNGSTEYAYISSGPTYLTFGVNSSDRVTIDSSGNLLVGTTSANGRLSIDSAGTTSATYIIFGRNSAASNKFTVRSDGAGFLDSAAWTYGSDATIKENIEYLEPSNCLSLLLNAKPAKFDYIEGQKANYGYIAQDVQKWLPEAVSETPSGKLGLQDGFINAIGTGAIQALHQLIQEQQALITQLTARITALEGA